jgi:hypothetical protein
MNNPWLKKNPLMSMWLSGFNTAANSARGHMSAEMQRQARGMITAGTQQMLRFWSGGLLAPSLTKKKPARRRR